MAEGVRPRSGRGMFWGFIVLMLGLMAAFVFLGSWQMARLDEKERLIQSVEQRSGLSPQELPPLAEWNGFDSPTWAYRPVLVSGTYRPAETVLVFTSLVDQRGTYGGPGYWVMTPLELATGGVVFINRGFVPQDSATAFASGGTAEPGLISLTGIARAPEQISSFTPAADPARRIDWVRTPSRLADTAGLSNATVAPITIDLPAGPPGTLPQGGETVVNFPNNHLGYAITWFGFAALVPFLLAVWVRRERQSARAEP